MRRSPSEACKNAKDCSRLYNGIISKCVQKRTSIFRNELSNINDKIKKEGWMKQGNYVCNGIEALLSAEEAYAMNGKNKSTYLIHSISISVLMLGMFLIFLIFYKINGHIIYFWKIYILLLLCYFSTFGTWLNKTVLKKNKYRYNLYEEKKNGLLERKSEKSNTNFKNDPYIIAYSPVQV